MTRLDPVHPGEALKRDFMDPFGLSVTALAKALGVTPRRDKGDATSATRRMTSSSTSMTLEN